MEAFSGLEHFHVQKCHRYQWKAAQKCVSKANKPSIPKLGNSDLEPKIVRDRSRWCFGQLSGPTRFPDTKTWKLRSGDQTGADGTLVNYPASASTFQTFQTTHSISRERCTCSRAQLLRLGRGSHTQHSWVNCSTCRALASIVVLKHPSSAGSSMALKSLSHLKDLS